MSGCEERPKPECFGGGGISPAFGCLDCKYVIACLMGDSNIER